MNMDRTVQAIARLADIPATPEVIESALAHNDISKMPAKDRNAYLMASCLSLGLNPLTHPFDILEGQDGGYHLYLNKTGAEQLRKNHRVSIKVLSRERIGDLYTVSVRASLPDGRCEDVEAIVALTRPKKVARGTWKDGNPRMVTEVDENGEDVEIPLKGTPLANAMMRCESKAKRRATLALCGLGFQDTDDRHEDAEPVQVEPFNGTADDAIGNIFGDREEPVRQLSAPGEGDDTPGETGGESLPSEVQNFSESGATWEDKKDMFWDEVAAARDSSGISYSYEAIVGYIYTEYPSGPSESSWKHILGWFDNPDWLNREIKLKRTKIKDKMDQMGLGKSELK